MGIDNAFTAMWDSLKEDNGFEDDVFDEFIIGFEDEYKKCKGNLSKKFSTFLENNQFLHDSEIIEVSVKSYLSNKRYQCDVIMNIKTSQGKKLHTITYKNVSKVIIERYKENNTRWIWGYGYIKKIEDNSIEQGIICYPCTLIKINFKKITLE
jgi:hypothetical protein